MRQEFRAIMNRFGAFGADRRGNFAVLTAVTAAAMALGVGFGVNITQLYNIKSGLRNALDAAITSTARDITTGKIKPEDARARFEAFFFANADPELASADRLVLGQLVVDRTARTITATAHVDADLFFPLFSTGPTQRVAGQSAAVYSDKTIEVAMMLDVTGSMAADKWGKSDKIGDLKAAAENAINLLLPDDDQDEPNPRVRVAIVPYAEAVNTGALANGTVFVEEKNGPNLPPAISDPIPASTSSREDNCAMERKTKDGKADFSDDGPATERRNNQGKIYLAKVNRDDRISRDRYDNTLMCPKAELVPLTANKQKLLDAIGDFEAAGVTAGGIAVQWGYYMLSPDWRAAIADADLGSGPAAYNPKKVAKVAILMTDGQFNTAFAGVKDGSTPQSQQGAKSRDYAENLCSNMKEDKIEVFTIGFALDDPKMSREEREQAKAVLKDCSTPDTSSIKHYFEVSTGEELDAAFREIISNTERLALIK